MQGLFVVTLIQLYTAKLLSTPSIHRKEITLAHGKKLAEVKQEKKPNKEWILWTLAVAFIVGTIAFLLVIDAIYAPGLNNPATLPEAVGK